MMKKKNRSIIIDNPTSDIVLNHPFKDILPDIDEFFKVNNEYGVIITIESLCNRIESLAEKYKNLMEEKDFKGYSLELFAEYLIKTNSSDNRVGIYDYSPLFSDEEDLGVDGRGIGENGYPATVQVKYRNGGAPLLNANDDHLSNFLAASTFDEGVRKEDDKNMLIITTAPGVNEYTSTKMLKGKVRCLNRNALREMLDNRPEWWLKFYEAVKASRLKEEVRKIIELRDHQIEAVEAIQKKKNKKGKIILPTGTGKTLIEAEIIYRNIIDIQKEGFIPVIKINSPRILLCFQLFEEIFTYLNNKNIVAKYVNYNSGKSNDKKYISELRKIGGVYREISSTTSYKEVSEIYRKCQGEGIPMIVFSTYHSSEKFAKSDIVPHLTIHDEAHNLVSKQFYKAAELDTDANYFFTATEKITDSDDGLGMNNFNIFDDIIYSKSPKEMIQKGEMVPPYIHVVKAKEKIDFKKLDKDYEVLLDSISDAFEAHQKKLKELSYCPSEIGAKVLVVCRGQVDLIEMLKKDGKIFNKFKEKNPDIHVFALCSDFGLYMDGKYFKKPVDNMKKFNLIKKVKSLSSSEKCIIFHVDMIGEGIDVPGITGVMPFRNCELAKFIQNIGRASRLHKEDRTKLYNREIPPENRDKWIKPYSWVIIPSFLENFDGFESRFKEIVSTLRKDFGYIPRQHTLITNENGLSDDDTIDKVNEKCKKRPNSCSGITGFFHKFDSMTNIERIIFEQEVDDFKKEIGVEFQNLIKKKNRKDK